MGVEKNNKESSEYVVRRTKMLSMEMKSGDIKWKSVHLFKNNASNKNIMY